MHGAMGEILGYPFTSGLSAGYELGSSLPGKMPGFLTPEPPPKADRTSGLDRRELCAGQNREP